MNAHLLHPQYSLVVLKLRYIWDRAVGPNINMSAWERAKICAGLLT